MSDICETHSLLLSFIIHVGAGEQLEGAFVDSDSQMTIIVHKQALLYCKLVIQKFHVRKLMYTFKFGKAPYPGLRDCASSFPYYLLPYWSNSRGSNGRYRCCKCSGSSWSVFNTWTQVHALFWRWHCEIKARRMDSPTIWKTQSCIY